MTEPVDINKDHLIQVSERVWVTPAQLAQLEEAAKPPSMRESTSATSGLEDVMERRFNMKTDVHYATVEELKLGPLTQAKVKEGPLFVTRAGKTAMVILSIEDYTKLQHLARQAALVKE